MKKFCVVLSLLLLISSFGGLLGCGASEAAPAAPDGAADSTGGAAVYAVTSPNGEITMSVSHQEDGSLKYTVTKQDLAVVESSGLGFDLAECDLTTGLTFVETSSADISYDYENLGGKHSHVSGQGKEMTLTFQKDSFTLKLIARAYNDGYAFRYDLSTTDEEIPMVTVNAEQTEFALPTSSYTYVQPYISSRDDGNYFSYEEPFIERKYNDLSGLMISMPLMYRVGKSEVYSLITESELIGSGYYGSFLKESLENETLGILQTVPTPAGAWGANQYINVPFTSPWRVGIVGDLATVAESELVEAVYGDVEYWKPDDYDQLSPEEQAIYNYDWVEYGTTTWSWLLYLHTDGNNISQKDWDLQKTYVDAASEMGWTYVLLDGGWDSRNYDALRDFCAYAAERDVKVLVWLDSLASFDGGEYRTLTRRLSKYAECGVAGVKIDFFDGQTMYGENDFQGEDTEMIKWYETVYQECAKLKLVVNCHGSNKPTGERRVYPNVICREGVRAYEMYPNLDTTEIVKSLFVRNVIGPSDFAPSVYPFKDTISTGALLATAVAYESGMSGLSDRLSVYTEDFRSFFENFPSAWEDMEFLDGSPSEYYCIARKAEDGSWFVACVNNAETPSEVAVDFSFLDGDYNALIHTDGANVNSVITENETVSSSTVKTFSVSAGGGFVIKLTK